MVGNLMDTASAFRGNPDWLIWTTFFSVSVLEKNTDTKNNNKIQML